jgi:hypothetical protein
MNYWWLLLIPLGLGAFVGFWCLVVKLLALAGWQQLAQFRVASLPPGPRFRLAQASVGGVSYKGAIEAGVSPAGLALATGFPFTIGHPPLLIPWSALGPLRAHKLLWLTSYATSVHTSDSSSVTLRFASEELLAAARPWLMSS